MCFLKWILGILFWKPPLGAANCGGTVIEGGLKAGADPDKAGVVWAATGVDKVVGVKCCRKGAICGGPMTKDGKKRYRDLITAVPSKS